MSVEGNFWNSLSNKSPYERIEFDTGTNKGMLQGEHFSEPTQKSETSQIIQCAILTNTRREFVTDWSTRTLSFGIALEQKQQIGKQGFQPS
jgi:hypothetical protein